MFGLLLALIYLIFISLGLPDAMLGSAWPSMYQDLNVPLSYCGIISFIIAIGTVFSSLMSDRLTKMIKPGIVCAVSIFITCIALFGFSISNHFWMLIVFAIPYGLGAGSIDAAINNYVAIHYKSRHMSWLHCMWGIGASIGPYIMGFALTYNDSWKSGYLYVSMLQIVLAIIAFGALPLWKKNETEEEKKEQTREVIPFKELFRISGVIPLFICFFCYSAVEQTSILWGSSYLVLNNQIAEEIAANFASLFLIGITVGRFLNGFLAYKLDDKNLIRLGQSIIFIGIILIFIPNDIATLMGLFLVGFGCAPIYPCIIHSIPIRFGTKYSQAIIGFQMAIAYLGTCLMPPLFGIIANNISISLLPVYLGCFLILMIIMHEYMLKKVKLGGYSNIS